MSRVGAQTNLSNAASPRDSGYDRYGHYLFAFVPPRTTQKLLAASPAPFSPSFRAVIGDLSELDFSQFWSSEIVPFDAEWQGNSDNMLAATSFNSAGFSQRDEERYYIETSIARGRKRLPAAPHSQARPFHHRTAIQETGGASAGSGGPCPLWADALSDLTILRAWICLPATNPIARAEAFLMSPVSSTILAVRSLATWAICQPLEA